MKKFKRSQHRCSSVTLRLTDVLKHAWTKPFSTKSDFARANADHIAMAASDGLITTKQAAGLYGREWLITAVGLKHLKSLIAEHI
jgi:hypothetical protein